MDMITEKMSPDSVCMYQQIKGFGIRDVKDFKRLAGANGTSVKDTPDCVRK
jgi:hypothetical protein